MKEKKAAAAAATKEDKKKQKKEKSKNNCASDSDSANAKKGKSAGDAIAGAIAGGFGSIATTPMDVVKTRMMVNMGNGESYTGVLDCVSRIWKEEGGRTFFVGAGPRLMHKIPANGLFFLVFEYIKTIIGCE